MPGYVNLRSLISIVGSEFPLTTPIFTIQQQTAFNLELGTYNSLICVLHIYMYERQPPLLFQLYAENS